MSEPRRIWWPLPGKLCLLERPGGGGRSHRPERRAAEVEYLKAQGVRFVVSTMKTRHNLPDYEAAGIACEHVPAPTCEEGAEPLALVLKLLRREMRRRGAVAVHGNRQTDFVAAVGAAYMRDDRGADAAEMLEHATRAGLRPTPQAAALIGVGWDAERYAAVVQPRSAIAASTSSGRSVIT